MYVRTFSFFAIFSSFFLLDSSQLSITPRFRLEIDCRISERSETSTRHVIYTERYWDYRGLGMAGEFY